MQIILDDWYEFIIVGIFLLLALYVIYLIVKMILNSNAKLKIKGATIMGNDCEYVTEHEKILIELRDSLKKMDESRLEARKENSDNNKVTHVLIKNLLLSQDALMEAFQYNNIGNGNLEKARKLIAASITTQDTYLIGQL